MLRLGESSKQFLSGTEPLCLGYGVLGVRFGAFLGSHEGVGGIGHLLGAEAKE